MALTFLPTLEGIKNSKIRALFNDLSSAKRNVGRALWPSMVDFDKERSVDNHLVHIFRSCLPNVWLSINGIQRWNPAEDSKQKNRPIIRSLAVMLGRSSGELVPLGNSNEMNVDSAPVDFLPEQRGQKRPCESGKCDFSEPRKRSKMSGSQVCMPSQSLSLQMNALKHRVSKLEAENSSLKDELDRVHCISKLRYHQIQHLDNVVQKLCKANGIDFADQSYSDPDYFSPFRDLPTEIIARIIRMVGCSGRKSLKGVCLWWNRVTRECTNTLMICCPAGMRGLIGYPRLQDLHVKGELVDCNDFQGGKYLQNIRILRLEKVVSAPFSVMATLPYLTRLELRCPNVPSMDGLEQLKHLEEVVFDSIITAFAFPASACHPKLRSVHIIECCHLEIQTRFFACCKDLEYLHIDSGLESPFSDVEFTKHTPKLSHFALSAWCGESTASFSLEPLATLKNLEYLNLKGYELDYRPLYDMSCIKRFTPGISCDIHMSRLLSNWKSAKTLESIEFMENDEITDELIALLPSTCPSLFRIILMDCPNITQSAINSLRQLKQLRCLQLSPQFWWGNFDNIEEWKTICCNVQLDDF